MKKSFHISHTEWKALDEVPYIFIIFFHLFAHYFFNTLLLFLSKKKIFNQTYLYKRYGFSSALICLTSGISCRICGTFNRLILIHITLLIDTFFINNLY